MATTAPITPPPNLTIPQLINAVWHHVEYRINNGDVNDIALPLNFKYVIGQQGLDVVLTRFKNLIQAPVTMFEARNAIFLKPTSSPEGKLTVTDAPAVMSKPKKLDKSKVPRPPNAFILYRQHHHPIIKDENPNMHNNQISIILGRQWKNEDEATIRYYRRKAEILKLKHLKEHPEYSYQPRKPTDKKRRMTRKKAAVLAEIAGALVAPTAETFAASGTRAVSSSVSIGSTTTPQALPDLEKTPGGNPVFTLGDVDLGDDDFAAMLEAYNNSLNLPVNPPQAIGARRLNNTPMIYSERVDEDQDDFNFMNNIMNWDACEAETEQLTKDLETQFTASVEPIDTMTEAQRTTLFDMNNSYLYDAALNRANALFNNTF